MLSGSKSGIQKNKIIGSFCKKSERTTHTELDFPIFPGTEKWEVNLKRELEEEAGNGTATHRSNL